MSFTKFHTKGSGRTFVWPGGIESPLKTLGARADPPPPLPLLATGVTKGRGPHQRLPRIRPAIRMSLVGIIHLQVGIQLGSKVFDSTKVAPFEKPTCQHAAP